MIGLMDGLRSGTADQQRDNQMAMEMEYRRQMMDMQRKQEARAQAEFDMRKRMNDMEFGRAQRADAALQKFSSVANSTRPNTEGFAAQDADFDKADAANLQGLPMAKADPKIWQAPATKGPSDVDLNAAAREYQMARGDVEGALQSGQRMKKASAHERFAAMSDNPEYQDKALSYIDKNPLLKMRVKEPVLGKDGKPTGPRLLELDSGTKIEWTPATAKKVALGVAYMEADLVEEGLTIISGVNKELGDAVKDANDRYLKAETFNANAENLYQDNQRQDRQLDAQIAYQQGSLGNQRAGRRGNLIELVDDKGNVRIFERDQLPMGKNGEVVLPPGLKFKNAKPPKQITEDDIAAVVGQLESDPRYKAVPYEKKRAKARELISGEDGGMPNLFAPPPGTATTESATKGLPTPGSVRRGDAADSATVPIPPHRQRPNYGYLPTLPTLRAGSRVQQLEQLEQAGRLNPAQAAELRALRAGR